LGLGGNDGSLVDGNSGAVIVAAVVGSVSVEAVPTISSLPTANGLVRAIVVVAGSGAQGVVSFSQQVVWT
jgi:hypothetical protein